MRRRLAIPSKLYSAKIKANKARINPKIEAIDPRKVIDLSVMSQ